MKTVRDACLLQPNALSIKLSDQFEQLHGLVELADYHAKRLEGLRPDEASASRELVKNQRLG